MTKTLLRNDFKRSLKAYKSSNFRQKRLSLRQKPSILKVLNLFFKPSTKGQATVEIVLITVLFMAISIYMKDQIFNRIKPISSFISEPWKTINGMMESGVWMEKDSARANHPNHLKRMWVGKGDNP